MNKRGFTVIEALVAIGILTVAISGGFVAVSHSLKKASFTKEQVTAFFMAQEGMEAVRYKRDTNSLSGAAWDAGLSASGSPCASPNVCRVDATTMTFTSCGTAWGSCPVLKQNQTTYLYNHSGGVDTIFKREIQVTPLTSVPNIPDGNVMQVEVRVTWEHNGEDQEFITNGLLYNWH